MNQQQGLVSQIKMPVPSILETFTQPTDFCDSDSKIISQTASNILRGCHGDQVEMAKRLFYWVRDHVAYKLGLASELASQTLVNGEGSCSNKANLFTALCRSAGIPAGFHIYEVKTKDYFGAVSINRLNAFISDRSLHVFGSVFLNGKWVAADNTDDIKLSRSIVHIASTGTPVDFDGENDALLCLEESHILAKTPFPLQSIDYVLKKKHRVPSDILTILNFYIKYLREQCIFHSNVIELEEGFFNWFRSTRPIEYQKFVLFERELAARTASSSIANENRS